jgi:hypothetical protein
MDKIPIFVGQNINRIRSIFILKKTQKIGSCSSQQEMAYFDGARATLLTCN